MPRGSTAWPRKRGSTPRRSSTTSSKSTGVSCRSRSTPITTSSSARATKGHKRFVQEFLQRIYDNGDIYQDVYAGLYCVGCEDVQERGRPGRRPLPRSRHSARVHRGEELLLPALGLPGPPARPVRRAARLRPAAVPLQRGPQLHRGRPPGLQRQPSRPAVGRPDPLGREPGHLCLGRRAGQLPQRTHLRSARRGPARDLLAARAPRARQGHPALPLRLLAGDAPVRRLRGAAAAVRPRLAAARQAEDLQDQSASSTRWI